MPRQRAPRTTTFAEAKPWTQSRTIWLSVLSIVVPLLTYAADNALSLGLPERAIPWIALFVFAAGSIRQRFETTQPIGLAGELVPVDGQTVESSKHELTPDEMLGIAELLRDLAVRRPADPEHIFTEQQHAPARPFRG